LQVQQGKTDREVADNLGVNLATVEQTWEKIVHLHRFNCFVI
jgi:DNA-binding CsgD family transcriptional regulator